MKNKNLYHFHVQLEQLKDNVLSFLFSSRIKDFYKHNGLRIQTLTKQLFAMQEEYLIMDDGVVRLKKVESTTEPGKFIDEPVMVDGKTYDEYVEKHNELMERPCNIII